MDSFLFPLIPNEPNIAPNTVKTGPKPSGTSSALDTTYEGTFLDVLGGSQSAIDQSAILSSDFDGDSLLQFTASTNQENLEDPLLPVSSLGDGAEVVLRQVDAGFTNQVLVHIPVNVNPSQDLPIDVTRADLGAQPPSRIPQSVPVTQTPLLTIGDEPNASLPPQVSRGTTEAGTLSPSTALLHSLNEEPESVARRIIASPSEQSGKNQESRVQPLLNQPVSPAAHTLSFIAPAGSPSPGIDTNAQQVHAQFDVSSQLKSDVSAHFLQSGLSQARDDLSLPLSRIDGDGKSSASLGISTGGESGVGNGSSGLTFGSQSGQTHGQLLDASPHTLNATGHAHTSVRAGNFDERLNLINASVPHRLQIDVQLSETSRVQVDVGVQQRQVFAGVLMDNPVLRNLAIQNVQDLDQQLGQADMDLEEFDVHDENEYLKGATDDHGFAQGGASQRARHASGHEHLTAPLSERSQGRLGHERGWHVVA